MDVILSQDIKKLGKKGEVVSVAEGYARNYLLPRGMAMEASQGRIKDLARQRDALANQKQKQEDQSRALGDKLAGVKISLPAKVGEAGKLFGAISNKDIAGALLAIHGLDVDKKKIVLKEPIKALGEYVVMVKLHPAVQVELTVEVVPE